MFFNKKRKKDNYTLYGGVSETVDFNNRANVLYEDNDNNVDKKYRNVTKVLKNIDNGVKQILKEGQENKSFPINHQEDNSLDNKDVLIYKHNIFNDKNEKNNIEKKNNLYVKEIKIPSISHLDTTISKFENVKPGLLPKFKRNIDKGLFEVSNYIINNKYDSIGEIGARFLGGYEANENLKMALVENYLDTPYAREHTVYNNVNEVPAFLQSIVRDKIIKQLGRDFLHNTKGIFIDNNTLTCKKLAKNNDVLLFVKQNKDYLINYGHIKKGSIQFTDSNFYNAIGKADIIDMYLTPENEIVFYIVDTYDYNKNSTNPFVRAGRLNQEIGRLKPYFIIYSVKVNKYTSERVLK